MAQLLSSMSRHERFHTLGRLDLKQGVHTDCDGVTNLLTDAQLLAMTLNEIGMLKGKGLFLWVPAHAHNVNCLADMINYGTDWSDIEMVVFMNKSQTQRLQDAESRASEIFNAGDTISTSLFQMDPRRSIAFQQPRPNETVIPNTVRIFPISSDNDTISWQENTEGDQILCYRDGTVYFDWLSHWRKYAKITPESTFATTALATASYTVRWRDLSAHIMASMRFENNEDVVQALNEA